MKAINIPKFEIPNINLPKHVVIAIAALGASALLFIVLLFTLSDSRDSAVSDVTRLKAEIANVEKSLRQSSEDFEFIQKNRERFDALLASDKLIPHTRRTAIREMQDLAVEFDLSSFNYNFQAAGTNTAQAVANQPAGDTYRVNIDSIELKASAPLDKAIYSLIAAVHDKFPGSMVLSNFRIERASEVSAEALNNVSLRRDSGLVKSSMNFSWRTAQQNTDKNKKTGASK